MNAPSLAGNLLVTGATGVAGFNALDFLKRRHPGRVFGIRPPQTEDRHDPSVFPVDGTDRHGLRRLFERRRFSAVLNCAGNCALKSCELDPDMARSLNVASAENIVRLCREFGARLVSLSTDLVFSGQGQGMHIETDPVDPITVYGKTMVQGEQEILGHDPHAAVLRISLPMGPSHSGHAGAIDWIEYRFRNGWPATLYFDEIRSVTYVDDLSAVFEQFLASDASGIYHLGGPRPLSLYQIAQIINLVGGYDSRLLKGCPRAMAGPIPPRAGNVSMNSDKLVSLLGRNPFRHWPCEEDLVPTDRNWHRHRPIHEPGSFHHIAARLYRPAANGKPINAA